MAEAARSLPAARHRIDNGPDSSGAMTKPVLLHESLQELPASFVAGIEKSAPCKAAVANAAAKAEIVANKTFHCSPCNRSFGREWFLNRHLATPRHAKKLQQYKASKK